jgi:hypothetical protein
MTQLRHIGQLVERLHRPAAEIVRVLHRDGGRGHEKRVGGR